MAPTPALSPEAADVIAAALTKVIAAERGELLIVDPEFGGEYDTEQIEFLTTGWVRVRNGAGEDAKTWALRRPDLGQMRALDVHLESLNDENAKWRRTVGSRQVVVDAQVVAIEAVRKKATAALAAAEPGSATSKRQLAKLDELVEAEHEIGVETRNLIRAHSARALELRVEFYTHAFSILPVGNTTGPPDPWPGWVYDEQLPATLVNHWRTAPLGRGSHQG